jgi:hypothetical protein
LRELEQVPPHRLLERGLTVDLDVGPLPEVVQPLPLLGHHHLLTAFHRPVQRAAAAVGQLTRRHAAR